MIVGNGDLSVSVYETHDAIAFRLGKNDVWDRRLPGVGEPPPVTRREYIDGILKEGWKAGAFFYSKDGGPVATKGTKDEARMRAVTKGVSPYLDYSSAPCPKPTGELELHWPTDLGSPTSFVQQVSVEDNVLTVEMRWRGGVSLSVEAVIPPDENVLSVDWRLDGWTEWTRVGVATPVWAHLVRHQDVAQHEWARRDIARNGALGPGKLWLDHPVPALPKPTATTNGIAAIEQAFYPDEIYPDGFRCRLTLLDDKAASVNLPQTEDPAYARLEWRPKVRTAGRVAVAVTTSGDRTLDAPSAKPHADYAAATRTAARTWWAKSSFSVPGDRFLEDAWYATLHARHAIVRPGKVPPGLFFPSTVQDHSWWHGDYHANYNFANIYLGDFTANRLDDAEGWFDTVDWFAPIGRLIARKYFGCRGVYVPLMAFPVRPKDDYNGYVACGRMTYMTGWAMSHYWEYYLYTRDADWLRTRGYPFIRDVALFYLDFLIKAPSEDLPPEAEGGLYHVFPSTDGESGLTGDAKDCMDRPCSVRMCRHALYAAIEASKVLGVDAELRAEWQDRLDHLAGDAQGLAGYERFCKIAAQPEFGGAKPYVEPPAEGPARKPDSREDWYLGHLVHPYMTWLRNNGFVPSRDFVKYRHLLEKWTHANGLAWGMSLADLGRTGVWTEALGVMMPVQETILQSWDGAIRLFPYWPKACDVSFRDWRAQGAFLVSASLCGGKVKDVSVVSEKGADLLLHGEWTVFDADGKACPTDRDAFGRLRCHTRAGGRYRLEER